MKKISVLARRAKFRMKCLATLGAMARALRAEDYGKFFRLEDEFDDYADSLLVVAFDDPEL